MADVTSTKKAPALPQQEQETQHYLVFEAALKTAYEKGQLKWDGEGDQEAFIEKLEKNTQAKAEFNRQCKVELGTKYVNEQRGNQGRLQGVHPPKEAVDAAVNVYNDFLEYYKKNGRLPITGYQKVCEERDRAIEELERLKSKTMEMPEVKEALPTVGKAKEEGKALQQGHLVKDEEGAVSEQKVKVEK